MRFDFASPETAAPFPFWTLKTEYPLVKYVLFAASVQSGAPWPAFQRAKFIDLEYRAAPGSAMTRKEHNDTPVQSQSEHLRDRHSDGAAGNENGSDRPSVGGETPVASARSRPFGRLHTEMTIFRVFAEQEETPLWATKNETSHVIFTAKEP